LHLAAAPEIDAEELSRDGLQVRMPPTDERIIQKKIGGAFTAHNDEGQSMMVAKASRKSRIFAFDGQWGS
jgi:hypothetical protein